MSKHFARSKINFYTLGYLGLLKLDSMSEKPISDRIKMAHTIEIESAMRRKVALKVSWYDVHGKNHTQHYSLGEGSTIEL